MLVLVKWGPQKAKIKSFDLVRIQNHCLRNRSTVVVRSRFVQLLVHAIYDCAALYKRELKINLRSSLSQVKQSLWPKGVHNTDSVDGNWECKEGMNLHLYWSLRK